MDLLNSLSTAVFGIAVVFAVLIGLIVMIKLMNVAVSATGKKPHNVVVTALPETPAVVTAPKPAAPSGPQELKLTNVDEKTAAMIMAIVCDETGIPVNELYFKSIRLLDDQVPATSKGE